MEYKFTEEIKSKWLEALKSGKYIQGFRNLEYIVAGEQRHCCIGVLGCIVEGLSNKLNGEAPSPYNFLGATIGDALKMNLYFTNDEGESHNLRDYSNVIPLIEKLPTNE